MMSKSTLISEMQKFHFGSRVLCSDGESGILAHIVFDSATRRLTYIGVKQSRLFGKTVYLPFNTLVEATGEGITLNITRAELAAASTTAQGAALDNKSTVERADSANRGTLLLVATHPENGELAYIAAHHLRPGHDTLLQGQYITNIAPGHISVTISDEALNALPPYRPDNELQREVENIIFDLTPLHIDMRGIKARVLDSVLYLDGNISSTLRGDIVHDQALGVPGLLEIKSNLVGDDQLAADIAMALAQDSRTRDLSIGVYPRLGDVRLSGSVHTSQQKAAAEEIVRNFPGVRSVTHDLVVNPKAGMLQVMSSTGVESEDKVPGKYIRHTK